MKHKISKILIFSAARSDLNILSPIIKKLKKTFDLTLVQNETNSKTIIIKNKIIIKFDYIIKNYFNSDTPEEVNKIINNIINKMSEILTKTEPDLILLVGAYEMLAVNTAALPLTFH